MSESQNTPQPVDPSLDIKLRMAKWRELAAQGIYPPREEVATFLAHIRAERFSAAGTSSTSKRTTTTKAAPRTESQLMDLFKKNAS